MMTRSPRAAFSLLELLLAILVIAIVISLLQPVVLYLVELSRDRKCTNSLRQLQLAYMGYVVDHDGRLTNYRTWTPDPVTGTLVAGAFWSAKIKPYLSPTKTSLFICPAERTGATPMYGLNSTISDNNDSERLASISYPSQRLLLVDSYNTTRITPTKTDEEAAFRHGGRAQAIYLDGSMESLAPAEIPNATRDDKKSLRYRAFWFGVD